MKLSKYVIKNCPCYWSIGGDDGCDLDSTKACKDTTDCLLKKIYEDVKTVYKTPEYFEELAKKGDREQELIESCWHNVAHMVISKLDIQEIE